jgi:GNAT superfamily N-acetyltransferase
MIGLRSIRAAKQEDLPRIWAIRHGVVENTLQDPSVVTDEEVAWYMSDAIVLVAEDEGTVTGFLCADQRIGYVWALFVDDTRHGRGIGSALLDAAIAGFKAAGIVQAHLTTGADTKAFDFYRARGFRPTGTSFKGEAVMVRAL